MLLACALGLGTCVTFCVTERLPFLEIDRTLTSGGGYGFIIGMSKEQAMAAVREQYGADEWKRVAENPASNTWTIRAGGAWVDHVYLYYASERLYSIRRCRYVVERP